MIDLSTNRQKILIISLIIGFIAISGLIIGRIGMTAFWFFLGVGLLAILIRLPLYVVFSLWFIIAPFTQGRVFDLGLGIPDLSFDRIFFLILIGRIILQELANLRKVKFSFGLEDVLLFLFTGWGFFSVLFWKKVDTFGQFGALFNQFLIPIGFYIIVQNAVKSEKQLKNLIMIATIVLMLLAIPTPIEEITGINLLGHASEMMSGVIRVQSFARSAWEFGTIAVILLAFSWHGLIFPYGAWRRLLSIIAVLLGSLGILLTFMRATWLAAAIITFLFLLSVPRLRKYVVVLILLVVLIAWVFGPQIVQSEVWNTRVLDTGNILVRQNLLQQQFDLWLKSPFFGQGLMPGFQDFNTPTLSVMSHNTFTSILTDFGLMGLLYFLAILVILIKGIRNYKHLSSNTIIGKGLWLALVCAVLAYTIEAATFETRLFPLITIYLWVSLGLIKVVTKLTAHG